MDFNYLKNILNNLIQRFENPKLKNVFELKRELHLLNENEKNLIKNKICEQEYNIGTFFVIKLLKAENILNISEYLENKNEFEVLQIITDLIDDSKNSFDLLLEILQSNKFQDQIEESLRSYMKDLIEHPELIRVELIATTCASLPSNIFQNSILKKCLNDLIYFADEKSKDLPQIISEQKKINESFKENQKLVKMMEVIILSYSEFIVNELTRMIKEEGTNWFYLLMLISSLKEEHAGFKNIKNVISLHFKSFRENNDLKSLYISIILARQIFHYSTSIEESTYKTWVKNNFGELKYFVKEAGAFNELLQTLQNLVVYENDCEILKIHISCQMSAPSKMYSAVLEYKEILKSKQEVLTNKMEIY